MIIRFRSKDGTFRVNAEPGDSLNDLISRLETQLPPHGPVLLSTSPNTPGTGSSPRWTERLDQLGIKHGDLYFASYSSDQASDQASEQGGTNPTTSSNGAASGAASGDAGLSGLDAQLASQSGRIPREQTSLCTHGPKGMCEYCQPLDPWNEEYQHAQGIKHMSVHAWRKKVHEEGGWLEEPSYLVKSPCPSGHAPWPKSFCSKCQPPAITLRRQPFRMVDHVEFASPQIIERFIDFWRQTNTQRLGFLIGRYEAYDQVPLGIKAAVHAIWEPPQSDAADNVMVEQLPGPSVVEAARLLGFEVVGVIFTDLEDMGDGSGKVVTKRHLNSYFLSSVETAFAARSQNQFPHRLPSKQGTPERFSSRFVTCVVSGNEFGDIDIACYQVSDQAEALMKADLVVPSTNPAYMRIKEPSPQRYVPDISYRRINEYKLAITENAKPAFPIDYLLVSLSHGFSSGSGSVGTAHAFPIENRPQLQNQTPSLLAETLHLSAMTGIDTEQLRDFHVLLYLLDLGVLQREDQRLLHAVIKLGEEPIDLEKLTDVSLQFSSGPGINTLRMLAS